MYPTLREGSRGESVKQVQRILGIAVDGIYGSVTKQTVMDYQRRKGLRVDGIVGSQTWAALLGQTSVVTSPTTGGVTPMPTTGNVDFGGYTGIINNVIGGVILFGIFKVIRGIF